MMILHLERNTDPGFVEIRASMEDDEFEQLLGNLDELRVLAAKTITEPASVVQTGARHSYAKYLLFPVRVRRQFKRDGYDFDKLRCEAVKNRDKLYVSFEVGRRVLVGGENPTTKTGQGSPKAPGDVRG